MALKREVLSLTRAGGMDFLLSLQRLQVALCSPVGTIEPSNNIAAQILQSLRS